MKKISPETPGGDSRNYVRYRSLISYFSCLLLAALVIVASCKKSEDNAEEPGTGKVTDAEIASVSPPTFEEFIAAHDKVTQKDPSISTDTIALSRAIFEEIKSANADARSVKEQTTVSFNLASDLTIAEWKLVLRNPIDAYKASKTVGPAGQAATTNYPCDSDVGFEDSKADALRHAYWNALMVRRSNLKFAVEFATAHETAPTTEEAKRMDLHNNKIGRNLATEYPTANEDQLLQLLLQRKFIYITSGEAIPAGTDALVYFSGKRPYDGTFTGSMTNPDSGGPWAMELDINQCDTKLRGQFIIRRGSSLQKRRFNGDIGKDGVIVLAIEAPFEFENPEGITPCLSMSSILRGTERQLSGTWISSNCRLGGTMTVSR